MRSPSLLIALLMALLLVGCGDSGSEGTSSADDVSEFPESAESVPATQYESPEPYTVEAREGEQISFVGGQGSERGPVDVDMTLKGTERITDPKFDSDFLMEGEPERAKGEYVVATFEYTNPNDEPMYLDDVGLIDLETTKTVYTFIDQEVNRAYPLELETEEVDDSRQAAPGTTRTVKYAFELEEGGEPVELTFNAWDYDGIPEARFSL